MNYPASLGFEKQDAKAFAGWQVDLVKYDNCWSAKSEKVCHTAFALQLYRLQCCDHLALYNEGAHRLSKSARGHSCAAALSLMAECRAGGARAIRGDA